MKILLVGGAGFIGAHMIKHLEDFDYEVEVLDNLSSGFKENVNNLKLHIIDLKEKRVLLDFFKENQFDVVMHFASYINVGESYLKPQKYFENNVNNTKNLLDCMVETKVLKIIFSSSAAIYGDPQSSLISEDHPINPVNPYGMSKAIVKKC